MRSLVRTIGRAILLSLRGNSLFQAQAVAFNMFLAFFPALIFLAGAVTYIAPGLEELLEGLRVVLPPGSRLAVVDSLLKLSQYPNRLLIVGALGTLMLGSQLMFALNRSFAAVFEAEDPRGFGMRQLRAFGMVAVTVIPWVAVSLLLVFARVVRSWLIDQLGIEFDRSVRILWTAGYFSVAILTAMLLLAAIYFFLTPDHRVHWQDVLPGAGLAMLLWWIVTTGFSFYVRRLAIYNLLYGGFAAAIGLLIWMYLSAVVIIIGAHFNHEFILARARAARG